ncbi:ABC transporter substrate-binding protein [Actinotalea sp. Marseille-Q4924]|uniref:ABC transporter substrate-binding protein n=1 Tax=Actinotalea sp. Marseille-Q4924 TaxID=2866571 RepID=UPI001CE4ADF1|nr:extracellular solute-binding protein [Actinotalea sp. Marseille-Q4924]
MHEHHPPRRSINLGFRRRGLGIAAGIAATLTLAACGGSMPGDDPAAGSEGSGGSGGSADPSSVEFTLSMQNPNVEEQDPATWEIVQAFMDANPDVVVNVEGQTVDEHQQAMQVAAQSGTLPEVFWVYNSLASQMAEEGYLMDLGPVLDEAGLTERFPESMLAGYTTDDGVQYGVPYQSLVTGFFVNEEILAEHGLEMPETFEDLVTVAETLSAEGVTPIAKGANGTSFSVWAFLTMLERFGYEDRYEAILAGDDSYVNEDFLRFYTHLEELTEAGAFSPNVATQDYVKAVEEFTSGNAAMLDAGVWATGQIQESEVGDTTTFWAGPTFADGVGDQQIFMNAPSAPLVVSAEVADDEATRDAVERFLAFYYSDEGQQILVDNAQTPVTDFRPEVDPTEQPVFAAVIDVINQEGWSSPAAQPDLVVSAETSSAMYDSIYGVIQGVYTPQQALEVVQATID